MSSKIFNCSTKQNKLGFTKDVQKNVSLLLKHFGPKFKIKDKKIIVPVRIIKEKFKSSNFKYLSLVYDQPERIHDLIPFKIDFCDKNTLEKNNVTYIANIHKTDKISGSVMVTLVLNIQRKLNVEKTYLHDGASVKCNKKKMYLSQLKMIEKFRTFYMKFGFEMVVKGDYPPFRNINKKQQQQYLKTLINNIKAIKIKDVIKDFNKIIYIISEVVKKNDYKNFKIQHLDNIGIITDVGHYYQNNPKEDIPQIFRDCYLILNILNNTKEKLLYKYLIKLFNDKNKCNDYITIWEYFEQNKYNIISYKKKVVKRDYIELFQLLHASIHWGRSYVYTF